MPRPHRALRPGRDSTTGGGRPAVEPTHRRRFPRTTRSIRPMKNYWVWAFLLPAAAGCYRQDPVVRAAQDLQHMAYDLAGRQEEQTDRLNSLRLGMTDEQVLNVVGPPSARESMAISSEESREVW